jgi:hypothetical protein
MKTKTHAIKFTLPDSEAALLGGLADLLQTPLAQAETAARTTETARALARDEVARLEAESQRLAVEVVRGHATNADLEPVLTAARTAAALIAPAERQAQAAQAELASARRAVHEDLAAEVQRRREVLTAAAEALLAELERIEDLEIGLMRHVATLDGTGTGGLQHAGYCTRRAAIALSGNLMKSTLATPARA